VSLFLVIPVNAAETPQYDQTFNGGNGAFFANGTEITIREDKMTGNTVVYWNNGNQVITNSVSIFGGGKENNVTSSNIIMESGEVFGIYGGGFSLNENNISNVSNSNIEINGGKVLDAVVGGGLLYSQVGTSNVVINNGNIAAVQGRRLIFSHNRWSKL